MCFFLYKSNFPAHPVMFVFEKRFSNKLLLATSQSKLVFVPESMSMNQCVGAFNSWRVYVLAALLNYWPKQITLIIHRVDRWLLWLPLFFFYCLMLCRILTDNFLALEIMMFFWLLKFYNATTNDPLISLLFFHPFVHSFF